MSADVRNEVSTGLEGLGGRRVAVTGAAGFIGTVACRRLIAEGAEVVGLDLATAELDRIRETGAEPVAADVTDATAITRGLEGAEMVLHTAAYVREWGEMDEFVRVNVGGTANLLAAAASAGARRVVHVSSVVVYGYDDPSEQDESAPLRTYGIPYIDTKSASDRLARRAGAVVIRPGDVYGPGSPQWVLRPLEMARAGQLAVPGDGLMLPVYVDDLVEGLLLGLVRGRGGEAYTVWEGIPVRFADHFARIAEIAGARPPRRLPRPLLEAVGTAIEAGARLRRTPPTLTARAVTFVDRRGTASTRRAREELGWEPRVPYDEGMRRVAESLHGGPGA